MTPTEMILYRPFLTHTRNFKGIEATFLPVPRIGPVVSLLKTVVVATSFFSSFYRSLRHLFPCFPSLFDILIQTSKYFGEWKPSEGQKSAYYKRDTITFHVRRSNRHPNNYTRDYLISFQRRLQTRHGGGVYYNFHRSRFPIKAPWIIFGGSFTLGSN